MTQYLIGWTIPLEAVAITGLDHDIAIVSKCTVSSEEKNRHRISKVFAATVKCRTVVLSSLGSGMGRDWSISPRLPGNGAPPCWMVD
jgi:hypothetical protein